MGFETLVHPQLVEKINPLLTELGLLQKKYSVIRITGDKPAPFYNSKGAAYIIPLRNHLYHIWRRSEPKTRPTLRPTMITEPHLVRGRSTSPLAGLGDWQRVEGYKQCRQRGLTGYRRRCS